jgi:hypothetical protein
MIEKGCLDFDLTSYNKNLVSANGLEFRRTGCGNNSRSVLASTMLTKSDVHYVFFSNFIIENKRLYSNNKGEGEQRDRNHIKEVIEVKR